MGSPRCPGEGSLLPTHGPHRMSPFSSCCMGHAWPLSGKPIIRVVQRGIQLKEMPSRSWLPAPLLCPRAFCSTVQMWLYLYPEDFVGSMASLRSLRTFLLHTMPESGLTVQVESLLTGLENTDPSESQACDEGASGG